VRLSFINRALYLLALSIQKFQEFQERSTKKCAQESAVENSVS
jgi:hypothetical protein